MRDGPHSSYFLCCSMYFLCCSMYFYVVLCIVCLVTFSVLFVCICVLNYCNWLATQLQLNISYHTIYYTIYHIISYHIISYHIISYHIISYHIISYHIISYHINLPVIDPYKWNKKMGIGNATNPTWLIYTLKMEAILSPQKMALTQRPHGVINWNSKIRNLSAMKS